MAIPRKNWTSKPAAGTVDGEKHTAVLHHTVSANRQWSRTQEKEHLRFLLRFHTETRGWSDIGYNLVLFPSGRLYTGRGVERVPAAQSHANTGTVAIAYVGDGTRADMSRAARLRLRVALVALRRNRGIRKLRGHRDFGGTTCPGDKPYARLPNLRRFSGMNL